MQHNPGAPAPSKPLRHPEHINSVTTPRIVRILGGDARLAQNDETDPPDLTPEDVEEEVRRIDADLHYNQLKDSGELERRRIQRAGPSFFEQQFLRDHQR